LSCSLGTADIHAVSGFSTSAIDDVIQFGKRLKALIRLSAIFPAGNAECQTVGCCMCASYCLNSMRGLWRERGGVCTGHVIVAVKGLVEKGKCSPASGARSSIISARYPRLPSFISQPRAPPKPTAKIFNGRTVSDDLVIATGRSLIIHCRPLRHFSAFPVN
jgi:hypothetical protein